MKSENVRNLTLKNRSYRKFLQNKPIDRAVLEELIDIARFTPSAANNQLTRYLVYNDAAQNEAVFSCLRWAAYYKDWGGPAEGEKPAAYIVMLAPENANPQWDEGIKGQTMLLAAAEQGIGGCFIANIDRATFAEKLGVPAGYKVSLVLALGYPDEAVLLEEVAAGDDIKYHKNAQGVQCVPKIRLCDLILN